jgi:glycerol kinase
MSAELILAIDQGTTNTKALLVGRTGTPIFRASKAIAMINTPQGLAEQDPELLWQSVLDVIGKATQYAIQNDSWIEAIAISNQRETALAWNAKTGQPVAPAISWQCERGADICNRHGRYADELRDKTGLPLAPLLSATKWAWLLENDDSIRNLALKNLVHFGTVDSWVIHRLTQGSVYATDLTNASRTGLLNLGTRKWDCDLLDLFGISLRALPELRSSSGSFGSCTAVPGLEGVPILSAIGDSHAASFGHGHCVPGTIKATYGTGSSLMALTPSLMSDTPMLARTIAWSIGDNIQFAVEGNIAMTGSAIQWLGKFLQMSNPASDVAALAAKVADAAGVYFVPAMVGLGAPHWDARARGSISGLCRSHTSAHLARAALESIAFQVADVFFAMEEVTGMQFQQLRADGGVTRNASVMQFQADVLGRPVLRSVNEQLSALGAAWLSGLALGWWTSLADLESLASNVDRFTPTIDAKEQDRLYQGWKKAVSRVCSRETVHA